MSRLRGRPEGLLAQPFYAWLANATLDLEAVSNGLLLKAAKAALIKLSP